MKPAGDDVRNILVCICAVILACVLTVPLAETGVNDDWSYARTAFETARTGRIVYNGWSAAMLGAQAYWGALFVKLFGAHFWAVRLSTLCLMPGIVALCYILHRQAGIAPRYALFGTLTFGLSPYVLPYAVTYMTDVPSLLPFFAAIYGLAQVARGIVEKRGVTRSLLGWLLLVTVASQVGGSIRQVLWSVPVVCLLWLVVSRALWRGRVSEMGALLAAVAVNGVLAALGNRWFTVQEYTIGERTMLGLGQILIGGFGFLPYLSQQLAFLLLTTLGMALPCFFAALPDMIARVRNAPLPRRNIVYAGCVAVACVWLTWSIRTDTFFPWLPSTVSPLGMWFGLLPTPIGAKEAAPKVIPEPLLWFISLAVFVYFAVLLLCMAQARMSRRMLPEDTPVVPPSPVLEMFAVWSIFYVALLVFKCVVPFAFGNFDRYLLGLIPALTIGTLRLVGNDTPSRARHIGEGVGWLAIAAAMLLGIASTHDYFAQIRALARVASRVESADTGLPRTRIMAGFEYDSWTQITTTGYYNDIRIHRFVDKYRMPPESLGFDTEYDFWKYTPDVRPGIVLSLMPLPDLEPTGDTPQPFTCWLPPFTRHVYVSRCDPDTLNAFTPLTDKGLRAMLAD